MSERISTRDHLGHVPEQKSLPKRAHRGAKAGGGPARPPQQEKVNPPLRLPDMSRIPPDEQMIDDLDAYRELAEEIINLAIDDVDLRSDYKTQTNRAAAERNRASAISFIKSRWCEELCDAVGKPYDRAKATAFK